MLIKAFDIVLLSFSLYKEHFKLFAKYLGLLFIPTAFVQLSGGILQPLFINGNGAKAINTVIGIAWIILVVLAMLFAFWITLSIIRTCADIYLKMQRKNVHDELADTRPMILPALLATFASSFMIFVWYTPYIVQSKLDLNTFVTLLTKPSNALIAFVLLIPAMYFGVLFVFATYNVVIHKQRSVLKSIKASFGIVRGRWWSVLWRLLLPWVIFYILAYIPKKLGGVAVLFAAKLLEPNTWEYLVTVNVISAVFIATGLLFAPLVLFSKTILYAELRKVPTRKRQ